VADQLAAEERAAGRKLFRRFQISPDQQRSARPASATTTGKPPAAEKGKRERQRGKKRGRG
jgi:hypothetical protein